jgi:hypothetical protein
MNRPYVSALLLVAAVGLLAALPAPARADDAFPRLIEQQKDSIVSVKYVVTVRFSGGGRSSESERSGTVTGVIIDPVGLIVVPSTALAPSFRFGSAEMTTIPTSLRVIFPGDPKEYDAVLGATDSRLGLSFLRLKKIEGKELHAVDMTQTAEPAVGMRAYGVTRLPQGFDYAPQCRTVTLAGEISKPRKAWLLGSGFSYPAHPLFTADGALLGFIARLEAVGDGPTMMFLLPLNVVQSTIKRAAREAEKVLEEALEREAEEEAEEAEGSDEESEDPKEEE